MSKHRRKSGRGSSTIGTERSEVEIVDGARRGRPGRRTTDERTRAVLELLSGKATVDQLALRFGVQAETIVRWRELAMESVATGLRQGTARSSYELDLEKQFANLKEAFTDLAIRHELVQKALKDRPSGPGRSSR
jgi:transposase-like protein